MSTFANMSATDQNMVQNDLKHVRHKTLSKINVLLLILRHSTASLDSFRKSYNCNVWNHNFVESIKTRSLDGQDQNQGLEDVPDQGHVLEDMHQDSNKVKIGN